MSEKPISDLRRRMLEDMAVRKFGEKTRHDYIRHVEAFARFLGRSPDTATAEDVRRFQVHLTESGVQPPTLNSSASALRFFFGITLDRAELARHLARVHYPRKLPRVLSPEEVGRLLEAAPGPGLKYKAALSIAYGAGLRAGEGEVLGFDLACTCDWHAHDSEEPLGYSELRISEMTLLREDDARKFSRGRGTFVEPKAHRDGGAHFDSGKADFAISLGEMRVASREQPALLEDWKEQLRSGGQLLDIEVATVLARGNRAQTV